MSLENKIRKILTLTLTLGQTTRPSRQKNKNKKERICQIVELVVPVDHRLKLKESEKRGKYLDLAREWKNMEHESDGDSKCNRCAQCSHQRTGGCENKRRSGDHPNCSIVEIGRNTKKSPRDLRICVVPQIPVANHQQTLAWKTFNA